MNYSRLQNYFGTFEYVSIYVLYVYVLIYFFLHRVESNNRFFRNKILQTGYSTRKGYLMKKYRCSYIIAPISQFIILGAIPQ